MNFKVGQIIHIVAVHNPGSAYGEDFDSGYNGKEGTIEHIDDIGQLFGTWGGIGIDPKVDEVVLSVDNYDKSRLASIAYNGIVKCEEDGLDHDEVLDYLGITEEEYQTIVHGGKSL